ncbi:hypothetical protein XENOCAPTIV_021112 [Xenoophorus captivus]|uniref:Uncharacterized protein n=1 Tax=Xenoophorus captivus TaxID=1517983 RepID=A0ABV0QSW6_9TELE
MTSTDLFTMQCGSLSRLTPLSNLQIRDEAAGAGDPPGPMLSKRFLCPQQRRERQCFAFILHAPVEKVDAGHLNSEAAKAFVFFRGKGHLAFLGLGWTII